jgi:hypothetical protein
MVTTDERREVTRYAVVAPARVSDVTGTVPLCAGRMIDISRKGCSIAVVNPVLLHAVVNIFISSAVELAMKARIVHIHGRVRAGMVFVDLNESQLKLLNTLIGGLAGRSVQ